MKRVSGIMVSFLTLILMASFLFIPAFAQDSSGSLQTLEILGANGSAGSTDPYTEFSMDNGQTWNKAYLYGAHPWGFVAGTDSWLNCAPSGTAPACLNRSVLYRISFQVPEDATNIHMQFNVKADNYASISINGIHAADIVGQNSPNVDASIQSTIQPGLNQILMNVTDEGGWAGINYSIQITMDAAEPPVIVDPAPTATISYSTTALTNGDVVVTLHPSEPVTVTNNNGSSSYTFTDNGSFTFQFKDSAGNTGSATATVSNIDKTPPVITINSYNTEPTNQDITVTASTNEGTLNASSHTFTENGTFKFTATDAAGNVTNKTVTVTNIDKVAPTLSVSVNKAVLNPPNHKLVPIVVTVNGSDIGSGVKSIILTSITSNENDNGLGDGNTTDDIQGAEFGTTDTTFDLRAERSGTNSGRIYTITYTISDFAGNTNTASATVTVPKGKN